MASDPQRDLLTAGRDVVRKLKSETGNDPDRLARELQQMLAAGEGPAITAGLYAALLAGQQVPDTQHGAEALGVVAGLAGHSSGLYKAARISSDVSALEKSISTGDPSYAERRARNVVVGRALGRAGVWRKVWN